MNRRPVRLLHTSDLHLGGEYGKTGPAWHGPECLCPLEIVTDAGRAARADVLLIAGDLFDNARVADAFVLAAMRLLGRQPFETVILPGNHDPHDESSLYLRPALGELPAPVRVLREPDGDLVTLPHVALSVWGRPTVIHEPSHRPLAGAPSRPNGGWYVVTAHGDLADGAGARPSSPIFPAELQALDADYLALGHWDVAASVGPEGRSAWYSGSPCIGGVARTALLVELRDGAPLVRPWQLRADGERPCPGFADHL